jgi:alpha-tubulin suppressor-like RCC1 family protein
MPDGDGGASARRAPGVAAFDHTCAVRAGELACWGENGAAQLGVGDRTARLAPEAVGALYTDFVDVCAGERHACALRADGSLWCWGENVHGELGLGDRDPRELPSKLALRPLVRVSCGGYNGCALAPDGALYCWGDNFEGKLGQADAFDAGDGLLPVRVAPQLTFYDVSVGQGHVCAITREGELYCWGRNTQGQLGDASTASQERRPLRVDADMLYRRVAAAQTHSCAITRDGRLRCWGTDAFGDLGLGASPGTLVTTPTQVGTAADYVQVRANWFHTCALRENGWLYCWGRNIEGQLGLGDILDRNTPARVGGESWRDLAVGHFHTCAFRTDEALFCWGENDARGQLGLGESGRRYEPSPVTLP